MQVLSRKYFTFVVADPVRSKCWTIVSSILLSFVLLYTTLYYCVEFSHSFQGVNRNTEFKPRENFVTIYPTSVPTRVDSLTSDKIILLWTTFFKRHNWAAGKVFADRARGLSCSFTSDKSKLDQADALLFHPADFDRPVFPRHRHLHQRYVLFSQEPPYYNLIFSMSRYNYAFNWTMTVRRDSDISSAYGGILKKRPPLAVLERTKILSDIKQAVRRKTKVAVARISNCFSLHSPRVNAARKLQQFMPLDFFGHCGEKCPSGCEGLMSNYKFYMSFENGFCRDYLTEKTFNPLTSYHSVPVVWGGSGRDDLSAVLPPHSYINAADFNSTKSLAEYLMVLDNNYTLYESYFHWKLNYTFEEHSTYEDLCRHLHNASLPAQVYSDLEGWFLEDTCHYSELNAVLKLYIYFTFFVILSVVMLRLLSKKLHQLKLMAAVVVMFLICVLDLLRLIVFRQPF